MSQYVKWMVLAGCLLVATSAQAQYGSEYGRDYGSDYIMPEDYGFERRARERSYTPESDQLNRWMDREQERYEQNLPAIREREGRSACDAIGGNDAARADCYRGLGGW